MNLMADIELIKYFKSNKIRIEKWFNIISPIDRNIEKLKDEISILSKKDWSNILK